MKQQSILKLDSVEVLQSNTGIISFITDNKTDAMLDLTARIFELQAMLENRLDLIRLGIIFSCGSEPEEHKDYASIIALLEKGKTPQVPAHPPQTISRL